MSESPLVCYTRWSPNHSGKRNHVIDTVAIHCVAANATVEALGATFANPSRKASSQYGIGTDGRIAQFVSEANRSWCTSSAAVDHRAITIEVSNNGGAPDWPVSWAAYESLIKLLVDICQRNPGIGRLRWKGNKNLMGQVDKQNMVVHRWVAAKSCVPIDSEVLTPEGWVQIKDIEIGDQIMCADINGLKMEFDEVYDIVEERKQDTYTNNGLTATKDHRMVYCNKSDVKRIGEGDKESYRIAYYKELLSAGSQVYIPLAGYMENDGLPLTDEEIQFYVAVQADGHYKKEGNKYSGLEFHFKKSRKIERIKEILQAMHFSYAVHTRKDGSTTIKVHNRDNGIDIVTDLCEVKYLNKKQFTWEWLNMSHHQAKLFLKELLHWDGCKAAKLYTSMEHQNLDVVSAVAATHGVGTNITGSNITFRQGKPFIVLGREEKSTVRNHRHHNQVTCVSVRTGLFLMRQNGKTFITGNCPGDYLYNRHAAIAAEVNRRLDEAEQKKEEEEEVDINKLIKDITPEQAYQLYQKAELHLKTVAEPAWSKEEGHWERAKKAGITDGSSPERAMKRDEAIAILGRLGQF